MSTSDCCHCTTCKCGLRRISSIDSNATADNLPGPGRNLGLLLAYLGPKLERGVGAFAARCGYGPDKVADAIARLRLHHQRTICDMYVTEVEESGISLKESDMKKLKKKCERLVRYIGSSADSTVITANNRITNLSIYDPFIRNLLREFLYSYDPDAFNCIGRGQRIVDSDPLLTSSRTALISVTEVEFQKLWSDLYVAISSGGRITVVDVSQWAAYVKLLGSDLRSFLAKYSAIGSVPSPR